MRIIAEFFSRIMKKYLPNAFLFAILLTLVVFVLGLFVTNDQGTKNSIFDLVAYWGDSFWSLMTFAMQMALIVATGSALASSSPVKSLLENISTKIKTPKQAIIVTTLVAAVCCWIHWGFGLILGALFAKQVAKKVKNVHYPLLVASAYSGFIIWHGGLSGSIQLRVAQPGGDIALVKYLGEGAFIPVMQTLFSPLNLTLSAATLILLPILNVMMMPKKNIVTIDPALFDEPEALISTRTVDTDITFASKLENSLLITVIVSILALIYVVYFFVFKKGGLTLNSVIFIFLFLGMAFHKTPINYVNAFYEGVKRTSGILLQFPFYAGIMGIMADSGLASVITNFFINIANTTTLPLFNFLASGILNFFIPSGGGKWAIESFFVIDTAVKLKANMPEVITAVAWGDAWTNMAQPFWALPLLSVANLDVKDILGYTTLILFITGIVYLSIFLCFQKT